MPAPFDHPFWGRGFRPFFAMGAFYALVMVALWAFYWRGMLPAPALFEDPVLWHGHEMVYGFTVAVIAGFLLTAVANWTGGAPARQIHLFFLCALWLAGRAAMNVKGLPYGVAAALDLAFLPALAASLAIPLLKSWNKRNFVFLGMLTLLFFANLHLFLFQDKTALYAAVIVIMAMVSLVGGRIVPAFTVAALRRAGQEAFQTDQKKADMAALFSLAALLVSVVLGGAESAAAGLAALAAGLIHLWRLRRYHTDKVWRDPLLWSLHLGYLWLVAGLFLLSVSAATGWFAPTVALHALTAGCIGTMTLSMMCRVTLGHTGRELAAGRIGTAAFACMQAAAVSRVFGPLFLPDLYGEWIAISALFWALAFALYLARYLPLLWLPRPDGRPA